MRTCQPCADGIACSTFQGSLSCCMSECLQAGPMACSIECCHLVCGLSGAQVAEAVVSGGVRGESNYSLVADKHSCRARICMQGWCVGSLVISLPKSTDYTAYRQIQHIWQSLHVCFQLPAVEADSGEPSEHAGVTCS